MAEQFQTFDLWLPDVESFDAETRARILETRSRWTDSHTWGIVRDNAYLPAITVPVSQINTAPNRKLAIAQFPIRLDGQNGLLDVGYGANSSLGTPVGSVAFDVNGERIAILDDVAYDFATGLGNTSIPLSLSPGVLPPSAGTYYFWIRYSADADQSKPLTAENGSIHYPIIKDGYRIEISDGTVAPVAPSGDGISVFLCKVTWGGPATGGVLTVTDGHADNGTALTPATNFLDTAPIGDFVARVFCGIRDNQVEIELDFTIPTAAYDQGSIKTVRDHILAIGHGTPTPNNPHGLALEDMPSLGSEPLASANQEASLGRGLVDTSLPQNSPAYRSAAFKPTANANALSPFGLDAAATGASPVIDTGVKDAFVKIAVPDNSVYIQAAFVSGSKLIALYPTLAQTTNFTASGDGWVGFANSDAAETYVIYGMKATLSTGLDVLLLNKMDKPTFDAQTADEKAKRLVLAQIYWDGNDVWKDANLSVQNSLYDLRDFGLVGPQQPSTQLKSDPDTGGLSQEVVQNNLVANSNYATFAPLATVVNATSENITTIGLNDTTGVIPQSGGGEPTAITIGDDTTLATGGPGAVRGFRFTTNAGIAGSLLASRIYHLLANLKPSKYYGIAFWYKADSNFNSRVRVGLSDGNGATPTSLMTLDGVVPIDPVDLTIVADDLWHRASFVVQSTSAADAIVATPKYLQFMFAQAGVATTAGQFTLTNVQVTEGEWVPGYAPTKCVPHGAIIMWDRTMSCPEGFEEITAARQKFMVGIDAGAVLVPLATPGGPDFDPAATIATGAESNPHHHTVDNDPVGFAAGGAPPYGQNGANDFDTGDNSAGHTHSISAALPYYGVIFCRAL